MIKIYPAASRYSSDHGWLKTSHSFSFAEYYDPSNMNFGPLRVLNDDFVAPMRGFGSHPHKEMEIVSIVLDGYLQHTDSSGGTATTTFGEVQRMSAGTGVVHSEVNPNPEEKVNFLQLWFLPEEKGLVPSYEKTRFNVEKMNNQLLPIVSKQYASDEISYIHQDLTIYIADLEADTNLSYLAKEGRKAFLFVIEGELSINETYKLDRRDSARVSDLPKIGLSSVNGARFMLIDLP
ncbi:pirin family protein [Mesobacillus zeae]|uniref:Pirin family protein n=1 Tax=Mesobacillus zeae TaxID=1917180 RepID=A0A398BD16_9BACI|nr:pirin-like bicupin family protein [Mesobacillus zeae]RID87752.1 pirin family protein [Mesobacillus zeae]